MTYVEGFERIFSVICIFLLPIVPSFLFYRYLDKSLISKNINTIKGVLFGFTINLSGAFATFVVLILVEVKFVIPVAMTVFSLSDQKWIMSGRVQVEPVDPSEDPEYTKSRYEYIKILTQPPTINLTPDHHFNIQVTCPGGSDENPSLPDVTMVLKDYDSKTVHPYFKEKGQVVAFGYDDYKPHVDKTNHTITFESPIILNLSKRPIGQTQPALPANGQQISNYIPYGTSK